MTDITTQSSRPVIRWPVLVSLKQQVESLRRS